jgi:hypothetical protein
MAGGEMKKLLPITLAVAALAVGVLNLVLPGASATTTATIKVVKSTINVTGPDLNWNADALCPIGKAVGGGFQINPGSVTDYDLLASSPNPTDHGWEVALDYSGTTPFTLTAYAVCN